MLSPCKLNPSIIRELPSFHQELPFHLEAADYSSPHLFYINMQTLCLVLFSQPRGPQAWEKGRGERSPGIYLYIYSMREGTSPGAMSVFVATKMSMLLFVNKPVNCHLPFAQSCCPHSLAACFQLCCPGCRFCLHFSNVQRSSHAFW